MLTRRALGRLAGDGLDVRGLATAALELAISREPGAGFVEGESLLAATPLFPDNGPDSYANFTVTVTRGGEPVSGEVVTCVSKPHTLTGSDWRTVDGLASRFSSRSAATVRARIGSGVVRLGSRVTPRVVTGADGRATFKCEAWHVCGNESSPASDLITATLASSGAQQSAVLQCGVAGLVPFRDNPGGGLTTYDLVGRHINSDLRGFMERLGAQWHGAKKPVATMPNYLVVTGATMRWGGFNPPHMTHRFGGTLDLRPIGNREGPAPFGGSNYHRGATAAVIKVLKDSGATQIRFADNLPGVTRVDPSHKSHIHVSWLREPTEPWFAPTALSVEDGLGPDDSGLAGEVSPQVVIPEFALQFFEAAKQAAESEIELDLEGLRAE